MEIKKTVWIQLTMAWHTKPYIESTIHFILKNIYIKNLKAKRASTLSWLLQYIGIHLHRTDTVIRERGVTLYPVKSIARCVPSLRNM